MNSIKRIAVLTGGGDAPGLNGVIRAIVKTAISRHQLEVYGFLDGFYGLITNKYIKLEKSNVSGILQRGGTILGTSNRDNPFRFPVKKNGETIYCDVSDDAIKNLENLNIDVLVIIGGDGSLNIAHELSQKGVKVIGVPKTIDNDLSATDVTFGFDTAVTTATEALDKLHTTAESHHRVMVLEVMGRYGGWIALYSGLAGGADVILIPEIAFDYTKIKEKIEARMAEGKLFSIIVVAEGAVEKEGQMVVAKMIEESTDPVRLGGIGQVVTERLAKLVGLETRVTVLGHLQRGGSPTATDRILSSRFGVMAANIAAKGPWGHMVALNGKDIINVPIVEGIKELKTVNPNGELVEAAKSVGISFGI
ncbi:MAG: 6-phosphofructokinase [Firmicutes bacterium HGW-Firmicutes-12]|nr:MAG: 6-phosphofructokinase [Firmicutes bacterium HGW-Firmicutes-12]